MATLSLAAATTTPTAGVADNLTITAEDMFGNTASGYTGDKSLTFGGASSIGANNPTVSNKTGVATNFGTATTITFTNGVASVSGANNGVMKLFKVETVSITVTDGTINNGAGLSVTVSAANAANLTLAAATTTPTAGVGNNLTITAKDAFGNVATGYTGDKPLTFGGASVQTNNPTVSDKTGVARNFGAATTITFTNGVSTVSGANNGVMKLYRVETATITVSDGTINNLPGLSVTVSPANVATLTLAAATTTPVACAADNLTITAKDAFGNTATSYTGDQSLTFGGASTIGANVPMVSDKTGAATNFGTATTITFTNGVATVSGANNGVMRLYKVETTSITVTDGSISNGAGLSVTVSPATVSKLAITTSAVWAQHRRQRPWARSRSSVKTPSGTRPRSEQRPSRRVNSTGTPKFASTSGGTSIATININAGVSSANFFYADTKAASPTITASSGALTPATQTETITAATASKFAFTSAPVSGTLLTSATLGPITVQRQDTFGNPTTTGSTAVTLASNSTGTAVFSATSGGTTTTTVTITAGNSSVDFFYGDTKAASPTITASGSLTSATQSETINAASATTLTLAAATTTPLAGAADNLTITVKDTFGNTATTYTGDKSLTFGGASTFGANSPTVSDKAGAATNFGTATTITFTNGIATVTGANNGVMKLVKVEARPSP